MTNGNSTTKRWGAGRWAACLSVAAVTFALQLWLFHPLVTDYFPTLDEVAMQAASTNIGGQIEPLTWFTAGLHGYFIPYPEWTGLAADFWRPLVNCWYWLHHQLFGSHWEYQLIFGYLAHALVAGLVCYIALGILGLSPALTAAAVAIAIFNPAYVFHSISDPNSIPRATQFPVYQIEVIAALLMMLAVLAFTKRRLWLFGLLATLAVLFKETALALPVAALLLVGAWSGGGKRQTLRNLIWLILPLAVWCAGRFFAYRYAGATHFLDVGVAKGWFTKPVRNLLLWPTGLYQDSLAATRAAVSMHDWRTLLKDGGALTINLAWWLAIAVAIAAMAGYRLLARHERAVMPATWLIVLIFALSNLAWVLLSPASELRYGYLWFALGPVAVFAMLSRWRFGTLTALALSVCLVVPQVISLTDSFSDRSLQAYRIAKQSAKQLAGLLGNLPPTVKTVYLFDDLAVQSSSPQYFAKLAQFPGRLVLMNNLAPIRGCVTSAAPAPHYRLSQGTGTTTVQYEAPECFEKAWNVAPLNQFDANHFIQRGEWITYHFPELTTQRQPLRGSDYDPGRRWSVRLSDPTCAQQGACILLGFDPAGRRYYVLND